MIRRVLVANRGEIALRIMRTCRRLGIETVAVFSDADADAPYARLADVAVRLGPAPSRESYLRVDKLIEAALRTGADAIHPGYGFLAENAGFATACAEAGVIFIGPSPEAIAAMGSKIEARRRVVEAGVPIVPGYSGDDASTERLVAEARALGFPVLLKASAGGGGKGMRIVRADEGLEAAVEAARREALNAFGDGALMIERYVESPRHVEFQILGDHHGKVVHVFERECSIQRRHQKIIEETPSVALDDALRQRMGEAAVAVGEAIGYASAGTVEFILDGEGRFYFLEVNTRLQVEHPVTELISGLDLVAEQLRIAEGEPLGYSQADLTRRGAAVECRLYAEDVEGGFLPSTGTLTDFYLPPMEGVRLDAGVETGSEVSVHYDPMLAKVITHGRTRAEATRLMALALRRLSVHGVKTNRAFLVRLLEHPAYLAGAIDTHFIDRHLADLLGGADDGALEERAAIAATLAGYEARRQQRTNLPTIEPGFRNNPYVDPTVRYRIGERTVSVGYRNLGQGRVAITLDPLAYGAAASPGGEPGLREVAVVAWRAPELVWEDEAGQRRTARIVRAGSHCAVQGLDGAVELIELPRFPEREAEAIAGGLTAPMPGQVLQLLVAVGDAVKAGQVLLILEAMKMEQPVTAPHDGVVAELRVEQGQQVDVDDLLVVVDSEGGGAEAS